MEIEVMHERALQLGRRVAILRLQDAIVYGGLDVGPAACPVQHHFAPGAYGREMTLPAGLVVVGKIHKHAHINVISKGACKFSLSRTACWSWPRPAHSCRVQARNESYTFWKKPYGQRCTSPTKQTSPKLNAR